MLKTKRWNVFLIAIVIFSMAFIHGHLPQVNAAELESLSVTLSDSDLSASATSTSAVNMGDTNPLTPGQYIRISYDSSFGDLGGGTLTCPTDTTASSTASVDFVECVVDAGMFLEASTTQNVVLAGVANPGSAGSYTVSASTHQADGTEIEFLSARVYIIDDVTVSARVLGSLTFSVSELGPYSTRSTVNGISLTGTSTATTIPFGSLTFDATSTLGHELAVTTNATDGYSVTVQQTAELTNGAGDTINSFNNSVDGSGSTTPIVWRNPLSDINRTETYGHMGLTTEDDNLSGEDFTSSKYAGLNGTDPMEVMYHNNPVNGTGENQGVTGVAYSIVVSQLQEAGDYETTLTYVCTPTY